MGDILIDSLNFSNESTTHHFFNSTTTYLHNATNGTTAHPGTEYPAAAGYVAVAVSVLLFGSNFVPVKKFETGDGVFFQWILCTAIWVSGLVLYGIRGFPPFYKLAMLGGFLWCTGNMLTVPIIKTIGLGQGILVWASFNLLSGWASARFGWFGIEKEIPPKATLNYVGVALCLVSAFIYMLLKTNTNSNVQPAVDVDDQDEPLIESRPLNNGENEEMDAGASIFDKMSPVTKRVVGTCMAIVAGIFFGLNFTPVIYVQNNVPGSSQNGLDYVFSHFCGIFLSSTGYFTIYCIVTRNKPHVYRSAILPGLISGVMWAIADIGWFLANDVLSEPVSFPIITSGPAIIGALWGIVLKEISGKRNFLILLTAFAVAITGSVLTGLSKASG